MKKQNIMAPGEELKPAPNLDWHRPSFRVDLATPSRRDGRSRVLTAKHHATASCRADCPRLQDQNMQTEFDCCDSDANVDANEPSSMGERTRLIDQLVGACAAVLSPGRIIKQKAFRLGEINAPAARTSLDCVPHSRAEQLHQATLLRKIYAIFKAKRQANSVRNGRHSNSLSAKPRTLPALVSHPPHGVPCPAHDGCAKAPLELIRRKHVPPIDTNRNPALESYFKRGERRKKARCSSIVSGRRENAEPAKERLRAARANATRTNREISDLNRRSRLADPLRKAMGKNWARNVGLVENLKSFTSQVETGKNSSGNTGKSRKRPLITITIGGSELNQTLI